MSGIYALAVKTVAGDRPPGMRIALEISVAGRGDGERELEWVRMAEASGLDLVWISARSGSEEPRAFQIAAGAAARTTRVAIGVGVIELPTHHPIRLAEDAASLDGIAAGRLELMLRLGGDREAALEDLVILRESWQPAPVTHRGKHHRFEGVDVHPKPVRAAGPPLWIAAATAEVPASHAVSVLVPSTEDARAQLDRWAEAGEATGSRRLAVRPGWELTLPGLPTGGSRPAFSIAAARETLAELAAELGGACGLDLVLSPVGG